MNAAVIGDLHFGVKEGYDEFIKYQKQTYLKTIKDIKDFSIRTVVLLGDITDNRKSISYTTMRLLNEILIDPDLNYIIISGNHDCYYKNTNELNSIRALFDNKSNVTIIDNTPEEITIDGVLCLFVPWISEDNRDTCLDYIKTSTAKYCFGHFDINGALMTKGITCKSELTPKIFNHFNQVYSGHFHLKSEIGKITYVGSLFQLTWNDFNDIKRWIHLSDKIISRSDNNEMFIKLIINKDFSFDQFDFKKVKNKFLKIIINREMSKKEEKILIDIIDNCIKYETIDNTILMNDDELEIIEDTDFTEVVVECINAAENVNEEIKTSAKDLILNKYESIQRGEQ